MFGSFVYEVTAVEKHPNADTLDLVSFAGYTTISNRVNGQPRYKVGDWLVYFEMNSILPDSLLKQMGFWDDVTNKGTLSGPDGNRVGIKKLRGVVSEGITMPIFCKEYQEFNWLTSVDGRTILSVSLGRDLAPLLGVTKYQPVVREHFAGDNLFLGHQLVPDYDLDNIEKMPGRFDPDEEVVITEKIHGTQMIIGYVPGLQHPDLWQGYQNEDNGLFVTSKGLAKRGVVLKREQKNKNVYVQWLDDNIKNLLFFRYHARHNEPLYICGELYGPGIQDLTYGVDKPTFRVFDIIRGFHNINHKFLKKGSLGQPAYTEVPILYQGKFKDANLVELAEGKSTLADHVREGIVITPAVERTDKHGRVIAKKIGNGYKLRKDGTEYN